MDEQTDPPSHFLMLVTGGRPTCMFNVELWLRKNSTGDFERFRMT